MRTLLAILAFWMACFFAQARDEEGRLSGVLIPNEGQPASLYPGGSFEAVFDWEVDTDELSATLFHGDENFSCVVQKSTHTRKALLQIPGNVPSGLYTLQFKYQAQQIEILRAVYVTAQDQAHIVLALLGNPGIGDKVSFENFEKLVQAINQSEAQAVVIEGNLTQGGTPEQFNFFVQALNRCAKPTWLTPGKADHAAGEYKKFFGTAIGLARLGKDALLVFDSGASHAVVPGSAQAGLLHQLRRTCRDARWTLAFTTSSAFLQHVRYPLTLFVDDPVDALLCTDFPAPQQTEDAETEAEKDITLLPWGSAKMFRVPDSATGAYMLVDILEGGLLPRGVQNVNPPKEEAMPSE